MQKSFSASTSTRLMKSCSRFLLLEITSRLLLHQEKKNVRCLSQAILTWALWCANDFILSVLSLAFLTDALGRVSRVASEANIRWKVPLDLARTKPTGNRHHSTLAITSTRHPGSFCSHFSHIYILVTDIETLRKHDSVHTIEDALKRISDLQTVELGPSGEASQQLVIETLPSILVLYLKRFLYDEATKGTVKISKSVQFALELEIPPRTINFLRSLMLAKD